MPLSMPQMPESQMPPVKSGLQKYMDEYGGRLNSMLGGGAPAGASAPMAVAPPAGPMAQAPQSQLDAVGPPTPQAKPVQEASSPDHEASFRSKWKATPEKEQTAQVDDLENTLQKGNQTIDSAYDEMTQQLGHRPDGSLSRKEKGMMLMEFGLNLMANSAGSAYGEDTGGAIGDAGAKTLENYQSRLAGSQASWDKRADNINARRADAKSDLGKQSVLESGRDRRMSALEDSRDARYEARDARRLERENNQVTRQTTAEDGTVYQTTRGGVTSALESGGQRIKERTPAGRAGAAPKTFESDARYKRHMEIHGKDAQGKPLTGEALRKVQEESEQAANSSHTASNDRDWTSIYRDATRRGLPPQEARAEADSALGARGKTAKGKAPTSPQIPRKAAPEKALQALQANPSLAPQFLERYGYVPEELQSQLQ